MNETPSGCFRMASRCWATNVSSAPSCFCSDWPAAVGGHRRKNSKTRLIPNGRAAIYRSALAMISTSRSVIKCPYAQSQTALTFKRFPDPFNAPPCAEFQHQFDPRLMARQHSAKDRAHLPQLAAEAFDHQPARAVVDCEIDEAPVRPGGHLDHVDALFDPVRDDVFAPF